MSKQPVHLSGCKDTIFFKKEKYGCSETVFQFQPDFAVVGVGEEHTFFSVEEVVAKYKMHLVGGGPVGAETVKNTEVLHIGIGESGERQRVVQQSFGNTEGSKRCLFTGTKGLVILNREVPVVGLFGA